MTAAAQLGNRLVVASGRTAREKVAPGEVRPVRPATPAWPVPAPPVPVPPAAPEAPTRLTPSPAHRRPATRWVHKAAVSRPPLYPRRVVRLIAATTVTLAVLGGLSWLGQAADPGIPERTAVVRVGAGETVWDVAARVAPRSDQRAVVERIRQLNGLVGTAVRPDQQLHVPDSR